MKNLDPQKKAKMLQKIEDDRKNAHQGEFFFANFLSTSGTLIKRPILVLGKHNDSNDDEDIIVCKCTTSPARSEYDLPVQLKEDSLVRTNKIYLVGRDQLLFKINHSISPDEIESYISSSVKAIN